MKFILLLLVVGVVIWMINSRGRKPLPPASGLRPDRRTATPDAMLACARCGVHVPQAEAVTDSAGRPYCGAAHRDAGPVGT
jgi:uncharacterized protein